MTAKWRLLCVLGMLMVLAKASMVSSDEVFSVPISDKVVEGVITLPEGLMNLPAERAQDPSAREVHFALREGTMVTVRDDKTGYAVGWVVKLEKVAGQDQPTFRPFEIGPYMTPQGLGEKATQTGALATIALGNEQEFSTKLGLLLLASREIRDGNFPNMRLINPNGANPQRLQKLYGKSGGGTCCVSCGGITVCGSRVAMDCGECDVNGGGPRWI
jgi:hypothetical protein